MSYKRHYADVSTGESTYMSSPSEARRPSNYRGPKLERKGSDDSDVDRKPQYTPTTVDGGESDTSSGMTGRTRKKAEPVKSACVQCQKRKTKCSGQRPVCRFCSDRNLECSWDIGDGLTRTADLKRKLSEANGRGDDLDELLGAMRSGSDHSSTMLLARLRIGDSLETLLSNIRLDNYSSGAMDQAPQPNQQVAESVESQTPLSGTDYPSPLMSPAHHFDWPGLSPQNQHMQPNETWSANLDPNFYSHDYQHQQQQPYFTTPNFDQSQMAWQRNDSFYPVANNIDRDARIQSFNDAQKNNAGAPSGVSMVPRSSHSHSSTRNARTRGGHMADT